MPKTSATLALTLILWLCALAPAGAQTPPPSATDLRNGLAGRWTGALGYRDYQSDELFEIPVTTTIEPVGDGVTLIQRSLFNDGPGRPVWITTASLDDPATGSTTSASYRAGRTVTASTETMRVAAFADPDHWTIVYAQTGEDDDQPADIRVTQTRAGDTVTSIKEVRPVGAGEDAWRFRNQSRLTRVDD